MSTPTTKPIPEMHDLCKAIRSALEVGCALHVPFSHCAALALAMEMPRGLESLAEWFECRADLDYPRPTVAFYRP